MVAGVISTFATVLRFCGVWKCSASTWVTLDETQARICGEVGLSVAAGLQHARSGRFAEAVAAIEPARYKLNLVGGSAAQRDVFVMIMLDAAKASSDALLARALFAERLSEKVHSSWTWKNYSAILDSVGQTEEAQIAAEKDP